MIIEIIHELRTISDTSSVTSKQVLTWIERVEVQRTQTAMLESLKDNREFDMIQSHKPLVKPVHRHKHQKSRTTSLHPSRHKSSNT